MRFDWQEGRKDSTYEYGHAGTVLSYMLRQLSLTLWVIAPKSNVPSIPLRWSGKFWALASISYSIAHISLGTRATLYNGRTSDSKFWQDGYS